MEQKNGSGNIDEATFKRMVDAYINNSKDLSGTRSVYFRKSENPKFLDFLSDPNCAGLEVYFGVNGEGQDTVILAGIDIQGSLMIDTLTDMGMCCPPNCRKP